MAGRHHQAGLRTRRPSPLAAVVATLLVVGAVGGTWLLAGHKPNSALKQSLISAPHCLTDQSSTLVVQVAPGLAVPVTRIAQDWAATNPSVQGRCIQVQLQSDAVDQQELSLLSKDAAGTSIWLPDSSTWAQRLVADRKALTGNTLHVTVHASIASSPLVAVAAPNEAKKLSAQVTADDFDPLAAAALPEPVRNSEGLLTLLGGEASPPSGTSGSAPLSATQARVARLITLSKNALPLPLTGFDQLAGSPKSTATFVASEQAVVQQNQAHGSLIAAAVYPTKPTLALDFPVVRLSRSADDGWLAAAADRFEQALRTQSARARFAEAGLRSSDGTPDPGLSATEGVMPDLVPLAKPPAAVQTVAMVRMWNAAVADSSTLAVIDLSGSMADPAGNGQSKVAIAAAAAAGATAFFPDTSALGLWVFSSDQGGTQPWAQLVPLGQLSDPIGTVSRRQALLAAAASMSARVHGGTALYDTVLAAYLAVRAHYDASKANSVVLMTDGKNEDTTSRRTLQQLLKELASLADPARPIKVITIGIGAGVDTGALSRISAATGGKFYQVSDPADISGIFLDAVAQRR
jgi:Ca-activated chloride channel family protein